MQKTFFTSDLHIGHANSIQFDNRPFASVEEMDAELIRRWNNKVGKDDLTVVLGDFIWKSRNCDAHEIIRQLNGQIILARGNHDVFLKSNSKARNALLDVRDFVDICVELEDGTKRRVFGSHYYMPLYLGARRNGIHLHGHSHASKEAHVETQIAELVESYGLRTEAYNVGTMHWGYEPVTLDEILHAGKQVIPMPEE